MIITVEEGYTVQPAQYEAIRVSSSITVSHTDLGVSDDSLTAMSDQRYDQVLAVRLRYLANALLWADLKPKLQLADEACADRNNLAAYILSNHPEPQLPQQQPTAAATTTTTAKENQNGSTKGNPQRPGGRRVVRRGA